MKFLLTIFLFSSIFRLSCSLKCPNGTQLIPQEDVCVYLETEDEFYTEAARRCASMGGRTAKIRNAFENYYISGLLAGKQESIPAYIGVEKQKDNRWTYSDGSPLTYQNWGPNQPTDNSSICVTFDRSGQWTTGDCSFARPFICTIDGDDHPKCPNGWVYNGNTTFCYYLQNFTYPDEVHWNLYNWTQAEDLCQQKGYGSHLASIHSKDENDFVYDLVSSNVVNQSIATPDNRPCSYQMAWIGYRGSGFIETGIWTDGSIVDFNDRGPYGGNRDDIRWWQMANDRSCSVRRWTGIMTLSEVTARFVCKMPTK